MNSIEKTVNKQLAVADEIDKYVEKSKLKAYDIIKRGIDIVAGLIGCIFLLPLMLVVKIINVINKDNGSIFYVQKRIGKNGKEFKLYKFRTMVENADKKLRCILKENEELREEYETNKKMKDDPRITKAGKILRKTSLDEFPQFVNILKGDMSLIGNRPYLRREKKDMGNYYKYIVKTKPGLTGLWQTSGRSNISFEDRLKIEKGYSEQYSLKTDFKIFLKTVRDVVRGIGAA
ncbi:MAG: sugar transferase [Clostridia bacterium]|nr:sugar transferase [Clostridia bacterium]